MAINELQRSRELARLTKPELISLVVAAERIVEAAEDLLRSVDAAYGDEP